MLMAVFTACTPSSQPSVKTSFPEQYNLGYEEMYGRFYDSVPYSVVALDLYSEGLTLNEEHRIKGTGYNLYLSDIFVPDTLLAEGEYHSLNIQHSTLNIQPYTFLPGKDYEGTPHGIYILHIEEDKISKIQVVDSGSFVYRNDSLLFSLYYHNDNGERFRYTPVFHGALIPWQKK